MTLFTISQVSEAVQVFLQNSEVDPILQNVWVLYSENKPPNLCIQGSIKSGLSDAEILEIRYKLRNYILNNLILGIQVLSKNIEIHSRPSQE